MTRGRRDLTPRWLDEVVVERALRGRIDRPLSGAERLEVACRVVAAGDGSTRVAAILNCSSSVAADLVAQAKTHLVVS